MESLLKTFYKTFAGNESICCTEVLYCEKIEEKEKCMKFDSVRQSNITSKTKIIVFRIIDVIGL